MTLAKGNLVVKVQDADNPAEPAAYEVTEVSPSVFLSDPARTASPEDYVVVLLRRTDLPVVAVDEPAPPEDVPSPVLPLSPTPEAEGPAAPADNVVNPTPAQAEPVPASA